MLNFYFTFWNFIYILLIFKIKIGIILAFSVHLVANIKSCYPTSVFSDMLGVNRNCSTPLFPIRCLIPEYLQRCSQLETWRQSRKWRFPINWKMTFPLSKDLLHSSYQRGRIWPFVLSFYLGILALQSLLALEVSVFFWHGQQHILRPFHLITVAFSLKDINRKYGESIISLGPEWR